MNGESFWVRDKQGNSIMTIKKTVNRLYKIVLKSSDTVACYQRPTIMIGFGILVSTTLTLMPWLRWFQNIFLLVDDDMQPCYVGLFTKNEK